VLEDIMQAENGKASAIPLLLAVSPQQGIDR
jgi:hypothetical protein